MFSIVSRRENLGQSYQNWDKTRYLKEVAMPKKPLEGIEELCWLLTHPLGFE